MNQKSFRQTLILLGIFLLIGIGSYYFGLKHYNPVKVTPNTSENENAPKITALMKTENDWYKLDIQNFSKPLWLCIQQDFYSKPSNEKCNSGILIQSLKYDIFIPSLTTAVLKLYSDNNMTRLYDGVVATQLDTNNIKIAPLSTLCGTINQDVKGNYYIANTRLLTVPGWQELIPFINKPACIEGENYSESSSFRVYFIKEK